MHAFTLNTSLAADHLENIQQVVALELALGCSLPADFDAWPVGLATSWNDAAEAGVFDTGDTLGQAAHAFLCRRLHLQEERQAAA